MTANILIWWLIERDYPLFRPEDLDRLPDYIRDEVRSREGREGRGRLWVPAEIDCEEINWDDQNPLCRLISSESAGGIVFHQRDFDKVMNLPGFVTDINCNRVNPTR